MCSPVNVLLLCERVWLVPVSLSDSLCVLWEIHILQPMDQDRDPLVLFLFPPGLFNVGTRSAHLPDGAGAEADWAEFGKMDETPSLLPNC